MKRLGGSAAVAALTLIAATATPDRAEATAFDKVIVFGDSLSDVGNVYTATSQAGEPTPGAPYYKGRYSNNLLWVEHIAGVYGITLTPSVLGGTDYAWAGAETTADLKISLGVVTATLPSLQTQSKTYLSSVSNKADPKALYVIWGGGNDVLNVTPSGASALPQKYATVTAGIVSSLKAAGGKFFLVADVPDVGVVPEAASKAEAATQLAAAMNAALNTALADTTLRTGIVLYKLDSFKALDQLVDGKTHFAFTNVKTPCITGVGSKVCANPDHTLFWDGVHPTAFGHALIASRAEALLP